MTTPHKLSDGDQPNSDGTLAHRALLGGTTFASGVSASSFALVANPAVSGLSVTSVTGGASGSASAPTTLAVRVLAAAHSGSTDVTSLTA